MFGRIAHSHVIRPWKWQFSRQNTVSVFFNVTYISTCLDQRIKKQEQEQNKTNKNKNKNLKEIKKKSWRLLGKRPPWLFYTNQGPHPKGRKTLFSILPQVIFCYQLKGLFFTNSNLTTIKHLYTNMSLKLHLVMVNGFRLHFATSFSGYSTFERAILGKWGVPYLVFILCGHAIQNRNAFS